MARRTKEEAEQTKTDIVDAALEVFSVKGYSKTTFDDIAKEIGMTKGALYWHFNNKPDLLFEIIRRMFSIKQNMFWEGVQAVETLEQLKRFFVLEAGEVVRDEKYRKFLFFILYQMEWSETLISKVDKVLEDISNFPTQMIKTALENAQKNKEISKDINIEETILMIFSLWRGLLNMELGKNNRIEDFQAIVSNAFSIFFKGLK